MSDVAAASLASHERRAVERFAKRLREELGGELSAVWLYGSRARGEPPGPESDIDLIVVVEGGPGPHADAILRVAEEAAAAEGVGWATLSPQIFDPAFVKQRRRIESFYMQEVDRDKIVLHGDP